MGSFSTLTYTSELMFSSIICVHSARGKTFVLFLPFTFTFATITIIITHDLLPSGLVVQSVEQRTIKSRGRGFDSHRVQSFFFFPSCVLPFPYQGQRSVEYSWVHLSTLTYTTELVLPSINEKSGLIRDDFRV